ncbi:hypothetical protein M514_09350 [Trichuris suis]|uniref:Uncharacterized protein n=1 Tax=Trichuris suis TaxID=68888 RepID=A0A085LXQ9_9BILA|nr:hypothetical protein M513_09350 [Trichuris suis]KFD68497.1 hypothetical protein M514_09350 [Trichuris suis]
MAGKPDGGVLKSNAGKSVRTQRHMVRGHQVITEERCSLPLLLESAEDIAEVLQPYARHGQACLVQWNNHQKGHHATAAQ